MIASFSNFSFVQFEMDSAAGCCPDPAFCLPMSDPANWQFYLYMNELDLSSYSGINRVLYFAYVVPATATAAPSGLSSYNPYTGSGPSPLMFANHYWPTSGPSMMAHFDYTWGDFSSVAIGECFKLMITYLPAVVDSSSYYSSAWPMQFIGFTNCFQKVDTSSCYTSVISYSNNSDAFNFQYLWGKPNVAELPMYLRDPKMENDQKVYTKSDGTLVKLYERKEEVYMLETDLMPYAWHKALDVALSHDNVAIQNVNATNFDPVGTTITATKITVSGGSSSVNTTYTYGNPVYNPSDSIVTSGSTTTETQRSTSINNPINFIKKENYEIEYQKAPLSALGKGTCKLCNTHAINLINNNCG